MKSILKHLQEEFFHTFTLRGTAKISIEKRNAGQIAQLKVIADKILEALEKEKLFINENLSVRDLAEHLKVKPYLVSKAINTIIGKNFFKLVNEYRVREVKKLIGDPSLQHYTLLAIGYEAGFTSKTAFNTKFKSITGYTPSQYKTSLGSKQVALIS